VAWNWYMLRLTSSQSASIAPGRQVASWCLDLVKRDLDWESILEPAARHLLRPVVGYNSRGLTTGSG
jgi:hypothetical protein